MRKKTEDVMTHEECIRVVSRKTGYAQTVVREIVHALRDTWLCYLEKTGRNVSLYRFGVFRVTPRRGRVVKSPFIGIDEAGGPKSAQIPPYKILQFRPSIHVRRLLNVEEDPPSKRKKGMSPKKKRKSEKAMK